MSGDDGKNLSLALSSKVHKEFLQKYPVYRNVAKSLLSSLN